MPEETRLRPFWSGTLAFGLVTVPVDLLPATRSRHSSLRMLAPDGTPLRRRYWCPREESLVDASEIVRGYPMDDDRFVVLTDEELDALEPEKSREIDLHRFVPRRSIDPFHFERAYFLAPGGETTRAYGLLAEAMEEAERVGIGTFVMRGKEHLAAILAEEGILRLETMRFAAEIRSPTDVDLEEPTASDEDWSETMAEAIDALTEDELDPEELKDVYSVKLEGLVSARLERDQGVVSGPVATGGAGADSTVIDLMTALKRQLGDAEESSRSAPSPDPDELARRTKKELYERARELDIPGRSTMTKNELVEAITNAD